MSTPALSADLVVIAALWGVCLAGVFSYCATVARQITYVTLPDGRRQERSVPFGFRLLLPFVITRKRAAAGSMQRRMEDRTDRQLIAAGYEGLLSSTEFSGLRLLVPIVYGGLWAASITLLFTASANTVLLGLRLPLSVLGVAVAALYPVTWLRGAVQTRHRSIRRALPFVLDILTLSVEAGLDFMTALQRHVERARVDALCEELIRMIRSIQLGKTRRDSLRDMAERVQFQDLRTVVNALVQADELGVSIGAILRIQSDQIRQRRFERAERLANEAPVKMLFPLLVFIFPSVFLILLGPVLLQIARQGF